MKLSGWGCYPVIETNVVAPRNDDEVINLIQNGNTIARGNGRAYGDCAVSNTNTIHMKHLNRLLAFDTDSGQLVAEAGVLLADVIETFLSRGWFPAVTPGTQSLLRSVVWLQPMYMVRITTKMAVLVTM